MTTLHDICPDFERWPDSWKGIEEDVPYGNSLIKIFRSFIESLIASGLSDRKIKRHIDNLWLLGGEIIRNVSMGEEYEIEPVQKLREAIGPDGGPYCRHLDTETECKAFDSTCRKLSKYLVA